MNTLTIYHEISDRTTKQPIGYFQGDDPLLNFRQTMAYLQVSRSTLYRLMSRGDLIGHKVGSTYRFLRSDLQKCLKSA